MAYIYDLTDTWNASGTTFNGIKLNVTDSASASSSKLVTLQTNGTEHFSITKAGVGYISGNLGIGTASPANKLDVVGIASARSDISTGNSPLVAVNTNTGSNTTKYTSLLFQGYDTIGTNKNTGLVQCGPSDANYVTSYMAFQTRSGDALFERMRITSGGNVGIGTSSPASKLDVNGILRLSGGEDSQLQWTNNGQTWRLNNSTAGRLYFYDITGAKFPFGIAAGTANDTLCLTSTGVGIGTTSPATALDVATGFIQLSSGATARTKIFADASISYFTAEGARALTLSTNGTERMRIDSSGRVLVGSTSTSYAYADTSMRWNNTGGGLLLSQNSTANLNQMVFFNPNGAVGSINTDGSGTIYATSSDYRLKNIDGPLKNSGAYIDALKPLEGWWKADGKRFIGFLAHQVQEVSQTPVVVGEKDGEKMQAMDYSAPELIANLIAEVQSLRARVAQLEGN
jgi:hypothetical protein